MPEQPKQQQIQIKAKDETLAGVYANTMRVSHTKEEYILDFMNLIPPQGMLTSRVIISPGHMKRIISALKENLKKYEDKFGIIEEAEAPQEIGFRERHS